MLFRMLKSIKGRFIFVSAVLFIVVSVVIIILANIYMRKVAIDEAENKAKSILDNKLAVHTYFSQRLKPNLFELTSDIRSEDYFDPTWMSSTFAIMEMVKYTRSFGSKEYYYKECAINARNPGNEADLYEASFLHQLAGDPELVSVSDTQCIDGKPFFVVLRRGEAMEASCLICHGDPGDAPQGLVEIYGAKRGFYRKIDDVVHAISIRIPLEKAYASANQFSVQLSGLFLCLLSLLFAVQYWLTKRWIFVPLDKLRKQAMLISKNKNQLGKEIDALPGIELIELTSSFNEMSLSLKYHIENLESIVAQRTSSLSEANRNLLKEIEGKKKAQARLEASEEKYRKLFESMTNGFALHELVTDMEGRPVDYRFLESNPAFEKLTGLDRDDIIGKKVTEIIQGIENDPADWIGTYGEVALSGQEIKFEQFLQSLGKWYSVQAFSPRKGQFATILEDISEKKRAEQENKTDKLRLEMVNEIIAMPEADEEGISALVLEKILSLSRSGAGFLGYVSDDEKVLNIHAWSSGVFEMAKPMDRALEFPVERAGVWAESIWKRQAMFFNDGASICSSKQNLPAGHARVNRLMVIPVFDGGKIAAVAAVADKPEDYEDFDIRQLSRVLDSWWEQIQRRRIRLEKERLKSQLQHAQRMDSIGTLAGGIAHDFNNMLNVITGNVSFLLSNLEKNCEMHDVLLDIQEGARQAQALTQQLLTFSKGGAPIKKVVDLNPLIRKSAEFASRGAQATCSFCLAEDLWAVEADAGQINQVVSNLIINANQAMPKGGNIQIRTENVFVDAGRSIPLANGRYARLTVADEGDGISEKHLSKIFDPYFTTKEEGSGLGLATAYSIIKRHGGHIAVLSTVGKGTVFDVYLPASSKSFQEPEKNPELKHQGHGKILIMDDQEPILKMGGKMLNWMGYETAFATNGTQAVEKYREACQDGNPFDLVILDLTIPGGMGGAKTLEALLKIDPNVKAVVSSGYSNDPVMANYRDYGFCDVVSKPYTMNQMVELLKKLFAGKEKP